ncbi:MAG: phosphoenolpyruvate synthase [Patescibacteria group bacterium]
MPQRSLLVNFKDIDKDDVALVGGKNANLGEMVKAGFPVPPGFAITVHAYDLFLEENNLVDKIYKILAEVNVNESKQLEFASSQIQKLIKNSTVPEIVVREVIVFYKKLSGFMKQGLVAVRSSATAEDAQGTSFAGQQASFLNVKGEANLIEKVKECWASLFTARSIFYRVQNKIRHEKVKVSVAVQKMVQSEVSGVMFSIDPVTNDKDRIIIESVWGLGEMIVQGSVVPDKYVVQKPGLSTGRETFDILSKEISDQSIQLIRKGEVTTEVEVPNKIRDKQKITNEEIVQLARYSDKLQKHYYFPQDSEWAKEKGKLYLVQTRPVTTLASSKKRLVISKKEDVVTAKAPILIGASASPGIGTGIVKILRSPKEIEKIQKGDVLVATMTSPDYVPAMKKANAIVTDQGGQTSHAAIVSRELGIPAVVGTKLATKILKDGMVASVNGSTGEVFLGSLITKVELKKPVEKINKMKTATNVYVNMAEVERAVEVSKMNVDGVGLLRAEFIMSNIGIHPREAIKRKEQGNYIKRMAHDLEIFCKNFYPRPIIYRTSDFRTNEFRELIGGKFWEPHEDNPFLGYRGAFRYISNPEVFNLELRAIKKVREKHKNLMVMIPFVRSPEELVKVRRLVASEGLFEQTSFKFWMMCELPVNVIQIEDFIKVGIDGISFGTNDLTMLVSGTDRDNSEVARAYNEVSPAMMWCFKRVIKACNKYGVTTSMCGQAPSQYDGLVEKLVSWGITSMSVNADAVNRVRGVVAQAEEKVGK